MLERLESRSDTIVACATPPGDGAIAVVRLSGEQARHIGQQLAPSRRQRQSHRLTVAKIYGSDKEVLDHGMVVEMWGPKSYTGEDVVELHVHGARTVVQAVLEQSVHLGARMARAGEFTLRAVLNSRMSLDQAESVGDLIASSNEEEARAAARHLNGELSGIVGSLIQELEEVQAHWQGALDFPEHPTGPGFRPIHDTKVASIRSKIQSIISGSKPALTSGQSVALCGAPNVGKSTLLNALFGAERALVHPDPGTTRDLISVDVSFAGRGWQLWDTAGIRSEAQGVEAAGVENSKCKIHETSASVWLVDPAEPVWPDFDCIILGAKADLMSPSDRQEFENARFREAKHAEIVARSAPTAGDLGTKNREAKYPETGARSAPTAPDSGTKNREAKHPEIVAHSASTAPDSGTKNREAKHASGAQSATSGYPQSENSCERRLDGWISGKTGEGIDGLWDLLAKQSSHSHAAIVSRRRHLEALELAEQHLANVLELSRGGQPLDLRLIEISDASRALGSIVGRDVDLEVLERIFAEFCVGK